MDFADRVLEILRAQVFHMTSEPSWLKIQRAGLIETNEEGRHPTPFGFPSSYGRRKGYVCLFDLRQKSDEHIEEGRLRLDFTRPRQLDSLVVYLLLAPAAFPEIIDEETAIQDVGPHGSHNWIPHIESWYPGPLPIHLIGSVVTVNFEKETMSSTKVNAKQRTR